MLAVQLTVTLKSNYLLIIIQLGNTSANIGNIMYYFIWFIFTVVIALRLIFSFVQVLLAMHANVEDRGIKGECTPLMEAASAGHLDIVRLLVHHGADVNAQSTSGKILYFFVL